MTDQQRTKVYCVDRRAKRFESDALTDEGFTDKPPPAMPFDLPVATDLTLRPWRGIRPRWPMARGAQVAFVISARRHPLAQRFMGPDLIVIFYPVRGAMLLALP